MTRHAKHVYCYQFGTEDCYKIGLTKDLPQKRLSGFATGSPRRFSLYRVIETEDAPGFENFTHHLLDEKRAENGEFFRVTRQELDEAIDKADAYIKERLPLLREVSRLRKKKPIPALVGASDEMRAVYVELRKANQAKFLLERRIELLESRIQVAIGECSGMEGIASWKWVDRWTMNLALFKEKHKGLFKKYQRNSGSRKFALAKIDLSEI